MRPLVDMLGPLANVAAGDHARHANAWATYEAATRVAARLPLVHRTFKDDAVTKWQTLLHTRTFAANDPCTGDRERAAGIPRAAYFFLGCGAYPEGLVGFVLDTASVLRLPASYTPFDSGSIEKYAVPMDPTRTWDADAKDRFLVEHTGHGADLPGFSAPYLAAHFRDPLSYVRRGQHSRPDFDAYHGLGSTSGDRRAFTIEVQVHDDVAFPEGGTLLQEIVAARANLVEELPDDLLFIAHVATAENEVLESLATRIAARIQAEVA